MPESVGTGILYSTLCLRLFCTIIPIFRTSKGKSSWLEKSMVKCSVWLKKRNVFGSKFHEFWKTRTREFAIPLCLECLQPFRRNANLRSWMGMNFKQGNQVILNILNKINDFGTTGKMNPWRRNPKLIEGKYESVNIFLSKGISLFNTTSPNFFWANI